MGRFYSSVVIRCWCKTFGVFLLHTTPVILDSTVQLMGSGYRRSYFCAMFSSEAPFFKFNTHTLVQDTFQLV